MEKEKKKEDRKKLTFQHFWLTQNSKDFKTKFCGQNFADNALWGGGDFKQKYLLDITFSSQNLNIANPNC